MALTYTYREAIDASPTFEVAIDPVRMGQLAPLTELAEHLQSGSCTLVFDDPDADIGNSGDAILGNQRFEIDDDACSAPRVYSALIGTRTYQRGDGAHSSLVTGSARQIAVELHDYNAYPSMRVLPQSLASANRPAETVDARFAWIRGTSTLTAISDTGYIASNTTMMDKADYRGQRPVNVINDCEMAAGFGWNCFIFWDDAAGVPAWFFDNSNTSTAFSSTLRISNVLSDLDTLTVSGFTTGTTFAPSKDAQLTRDPTELADSVYLPYRGGATFITRTATTAIYGQKDIVAPNTNVGTQARAQAAAADFLEQHKTEEDRITLTVELPPSKVNLIKAGHRIQVRFQHLPGYESFTWCRVLRRAPGMTRTTNDRYEMELELSPQEAGPVSIGCVYALTPDGSYYPLGDYAPEPGMFHANPSDGVVYYLRGGIFAPTFPQPGAECIWHFNLMGAGGAGTIDYAGDCVGNVLRFITVGNGTSTIQTEIYAGSPRALRVQLKHPDGTVTWTTDITSGDSVEVTIDDIGEDDCVRLIDVYDISSPTCGGKWGWSQMDWVGA